jgi:hypothetical protein
LRICGSEEAVCCVVTQIDATELPDELFDIEIVTQVPQVDGVLNQFGQQAAKFAFQFQDFVPDTALYVIELEQTSRDRTPSRQSCALCPSEPIANQSPQTRKAFAGSHGRLDNMCHD